MPRSSLPALSKAFWDINRRLLKVEASGKLYFTEEGRRHYTPLMARYGHAIAGIVTLDEFRRVMRHVTARQLQESNALLEAMLHDPATSPDERIALSKVLGVEVPPQPTPPVAEAANVVSLSAWRARTGT